MNKIISPLEEQKYLTGQLLIASPQITDSRFFHSVILVCGHDLNGAMGIILNRLIDDLTLKDLIEQIGLQSSKTMNVPISVHFGGPIEMGRGFVIHSTDYLQDGSVKISDEMALSSTVEILSLLMEGEGPKQKILALGYVAWSAGQLEAEIQKSSWLQTDADLDLVFSSDLSNMWKKALKKIGVDPALLSSQTGHA